MENQRRIHKHDKEKRVGVDAQAVTITCKRTAHGIVMSNLDGTEPVNMGVCCSWLRWL